MRLFQKSKEKTTNTNSIWAEREMRFMQMKKHPYSHVHTFSEFAFIFIPFENFLVNKRNIVNFACLTCQTMSEWAGVCVCSFQTNYTDLKMNRIINILCNNFSPSFAFLVHRYFEDDLRANRMQRRKVPYTTNYVSRCFVSVYL